MSYWYSNFLCRLFLLILCFFFFVTNCNIDSCSSVTSSSIQTHRDITRDAWWGGSLSPCCDLISSYQELSQTPADVLMPGGNWKRACFEIVFACFGAGVFSFYVVKNPSIPIGSILEKKLRPSVIKDWSAPLCDAFTSLKKQLPHFPPSSPFPIQIQPTFQFIKSSFP